ncbi:hypothetical protein ZWY2020_050631 [Hordeum vulgare]|nr:hypothetical protein ZWY2020_050631 [Hordeum vulgare]
MRDNREKASRNSYQRVKKLTNLEGCVGLGDVRGHGAHERDAVLGGSDGVGCGRVDNEAAVLDGGGEIDAVDLDAHAADDAEPAAGGLEDIAADLGAGAHDERIAERDLGPELLGGEAVGAIDGELWTNGSPCGQLRYLTPWACSTATARRAGGRA